MTFASVINAILFLIFLKYPIMTNPPFSCHIHALIPKFSVLFLKFHCQLTYEKENYQIFKYPLDAVELN